MGSALTFLSARLRHTSAYDTLYQYLLDDSPNYHHRSSFSVVCDDQVKQKAVMKNYSFLELVVNVAVQ